MEKSDKEEAEQRNPKRIKIEPSSSSASWSTPSGSSLQLSAPLPSISVAASPNANSINGPIVSTPSVSGRLVSSKKRKMMTDDPIGRICWLIHKVEEHVNHDIKSLLTEAQTHLLNTYPQLHPIFLDEYKRALNDDDKDYPLAWKRVLFFGALEFLPSFRKVIRARCDPIYFDILIKNLGPAIESLIGGQVFCRYRRVDGEPAVPRFKTLEHFDNDMSAYGTFLLP